VRRLRAGECVAAIGAAGLVATLFLPWFGVRPPDGPVTRSTFGRGGIVNLLRTYEVGGSTGWDLVGWLVLAVAVASAATGAWLAIATVAARPLAQQVAAAVTTAAIGPFALVVLALRVLVFQPGANDSTTVRYGAWLGLLAALLIAVGGWWAIKDERTEAPQSAYTPPPPRPAPPARS
jgi:hypothetical protein